MIRRTIFMLSTLVLVGFLLIGCGENESSKQGASAGQDPAKIVAPLDEYRQQAARDINEENAEDLLEKLRREIDADAEQ